jgi:hypothetical protein
MVPIDPNQYGLSIMKLIEASLYAIAALKVRKLSKYVVNRLFSLCFILWSIFYILDSIVNLTAAINPDLFNIASIIFSIELVITLFNSFLFLLAIRVIVKGEKSLKSPFTIVGVILISILAFFTVLNVNTAVVNELGEIIDPTTLPPSGYFQITQSYTEIGRIIIMIPILMYFLDCAYLVVIYQKVTDENVKLRMRFMILGLFFIPSGFIINVILTATYVNLSLAQRLITHMFWVIAPLLLYMSQTKNQAKIIEKEE